MSRPLASLSLDLDNQWSYMKTHGDQGWESFPSYLEVLMPPLLELLTELELSITVFVVGQDAALETNHEVLARIPAHGHEIACHSFHHDPWLHRYSRAELNDELSRAEAAIEEATGIHPTGFRGPGFCVSSCVLEVLQERGYHYDASTLPTFLGPLCRTYYFWKSDFSTEEKEKLKQLYGSVERGFWPLRPYHWKMEGGSLLEVPVTTLPIAKLPFHLSYVLYLSCFSAPLARFYFNNALRLCRWTGNEPSVLLHPLDLLGGDEVPELAFFPAMNLPGAVKRERVRGYLEEMQRQFEVLPVGAYVEQVSRRDGLGSRDATRAG